MKFKKIITIRGRVINLACLSVGFCLGLTFFFAYNYYFPLPDISGNGMQIRENNSQYHFINPLLECDLGGNLPQERVSFKDSVQSAINAITANNNASTISVYFRDLDTGGSFGINSDEPFVPASLLKVPILMAYLKESESNPKILQQKILFARRLNTSPQYFSTDTGLVIGQSYTVEELLDRMIINSDNDAKDLLVVHVDPTQVNSVFQYLGVDPSQGDFSLTSQEYATFFRILFNASYLNHDNSEKALQLLSEVTFHAGLTPVLPKDMVVAHKYGEEWDSYFVDKELHDCGIIYYPNHPYLLCVMTKGSDFDQLAQDIANISGVVYNEVNKQLQQ